MGTRRRAGALSTVIRGCCAGAALAAAVACWGPREEVYDGHPITYWAQQLHSPEPAVRARAAEAFAHIAPRSPEAVHALLSALATEDNADVHITIAEALSNLGPGARPALPNLVGLLGDEHAVVRERAAVALGTIGAAEATPALAAALEDKEHDVRAAAAEALGRIGGSGAAPALAGALDDPISWVRLQAVRSLTKLMPAADVGVPAFTRALDDSSDDVRLVAAYTLGRYGPAAAPALPGLRRALRDESFGVRSAAVMAIGEIGRDARPALPDLERAESDPDSTVRAWARQAHLKIEAAR